MLSFETKVWFTTLLPETPAFSAATTNLSFSPSFCHPTNPLSISPVVSLLHFLSIAPHYFAHSLSPLGSLWCLRPFLSFIAAKLWFSLKSDIHLMFNGYSFLFFFKCGGMCMCACVCLCICVSVCGWVQGLQRVLGLDVEDRKERKWRRHLSSRVWACLCVSVARGFSGWQITSWLDPDLRVPARSLTNSGWYGDRNGKKIKRSKIAQVKISRLDRCYIFFSFCSGFEKIKRLMWCWHIVLEFMELLLLLLGFKFWRLSIYIQLWIKSFSKFNSDTWLCACVTGLVMILLLSVAKGN